MDSSKFDDGGATGPGLYMTSDPREAAVYAGQRGRVRNINVPEGLRLLSLQDPVPADELAMIRKGLRDELGDDALADFDDTQKAVADYRAQREIDGANGNDTLTTCATSGTSTPGK